MSPTSPKVGIPAIAGGLVMIVMWLGGYFAPELFDTLPTGAEATLTGVIMTLLGWFVPDRLRQPTPPAGR